MARRILSLWLPALAMDRWRLAMAGREDTPAAGPLVLIADTAHGPRIEAVDSVAAAAGACKGMMLADARTLFPGITTAPADPAGDLAFSDEDAISHFETLLAYCRDNPDKQLVDSVMALYRSLPVAE